MPKRYRCFPHALGLQRSAPRGMFQYVNEIAPTAVKSAYRVIEVFEFLASGASGHTHNEIAAALDIPKSSLTQLLKTLTNCAYLEFDPSTKCYSLGRRLLEISRKLSTRDSLFAAAEPVLQWISSQTGETSALAVLEGDMIKVVRAVDSPQRLMSQMRSGDRGPLYATSSGKAFLAYFDKDQLASYVSRTDISRFTPNTLTSLALLAPQLEGIRQGGLAEVFEEYTPGVVGLALPILTKDNECIAALSVSMPSLRYDRDVHERAKATLHDARSKLLKNLGI